MNCEASPLSADQLLQQILNEGAAETETWREVSPRMQRDELDLLLRQADEVLGSPRNSCSDGNSQAAGALPPDPYDTAVNAEGAHCTPNKSEAPAPDSTLSSDLSYQDVLSAGDVEPWPGRGLGSGVDLAEVEMRRISTAGNRSLIMLLRLHNDGERRQHLGLLRLETQEARFPMRASFLLLGSPPLVVTGRRVGNCNARILRC